MKSFALFVATLTLVGNANAEGLVNAKHGRHGQTAMAKSSILAETQSQSSSTHSDSAMAQLKGVSTLETEAESNIKSNGHNELRARRLTGRHGQSFMAQKSILK